MKKAIVIGGGNGIGLAVARNLLEKGYRVSILDVCAPTELTGNYEYFYCNLLELDGEFIRQMAADPAVELMMITAGIGRVADFAHLHPAEIEKLMRIDAVSTIQIFRLFYDRIQGDAPFYSGVVGSIAGLVSSPMISVYAAAKAAVCRFVESVNIELEASGTKNRILNVSPLSVKGTRFSGGENDLSQLAGLAEGIVAQLRASAELYLPQKELEESIIQRYQRDPHEYGLHSYEYKMASGRVKNERGVVIGYLSGTFDLFHIGHLNLLRRARAQCDYLIVGVHDSGAWKGKETFIPLEERKAIVGACRYVDRIVDACREDSDAWDRWHFDRLFVGSDYQGSERFRKYEEYFADKGVEIVYFPYTQGTSSTQIREKIKSE